MNAAVQVGFLLSDVSLRNTQSSRTVPTIRSLKGTWHRNRVDVYTDHGLGGGGVGGGVPSVGGTTFRVTEGVVFPVLPTEAARVRATARDMPSPHLEHKDDSHVRLCVGVGLVDANCEYYDLGAARAEVDVSQSEAWGHAATVRPVPVLGAGDDVAKAMRANAAGDGAATRVRKVLQSVGVRCLLVSGHALQRVRSVALP